jgi:hypothetical protein
MRARHLLGILLAGLPAASPGAEFTFAGRAHDPGTGRLLYVESHAVTGAGGPFERRVVSYLCPDGRPFARKTLELGTARLSPVFRLEDARSGTIEGLERGARGVTVFEHRRGAPARAKALGEVAGLVADAGFDEFVRARWARLEAGDTEVVPFLVPSRLDTVRFRVRKTGETTIEGHVASVFRLSVADWLGWFLPAIEVSYRRDDRRLLRYRGITNLRDAAGDMISAQIDFSDADRRDAAVDLDALLARPLASSCVDQVSPP